MTDDEDDVAGTSTSSVVWRCIVAAVAALVVAAAIRLLLPGDSGEEVVEVQSDDAALSVQDAIGRAPRVAIAVRGYVYDDGAFVQLCNGLVEGTDPPTCRGPSMLVKNLDLARLDLTTGERDGGVTVRYTEEPVILGGTVDGTQLEVVEVLSSS